MDKEEFLKFVLITIVVLTVWYTVIDPMLPGGTPSPRPSQEQQQEKQAEPEQTGTSEDEKTAVSAQPQKQEGQAEESKTAQKPPEETATDQPEDIEVQEGLILKNDHIRTAWTNKGAGLQRVELVNYKTPHRVGENRKVLAVLQEFSKGHYSDVIERITLISDQSGGGDEKSSETLEVADSVYEVANKASDRIVFERTFADTVKVRKTVTLDKGAYNFHVDIEFVNISDRDYEVQYDLRGPAGIEREVLETQYMGSRVGIKEGPEDYEMTSLSASEIAENKRSGEIGANINESTSIVWAGVASRYFAAVNIPDDPQWVKIVESRAIIVDAIKNANGRWASADLKKLRKRLEQNPHRADLQRRVKQKLTQYDSKARNHPTAEVVVVSTKSDLPPGQAVTRGYRFMVAPKKDNLLASYNLGMEELIYFGWFPTISRIMVKVLQFFHGLIPNYGVAIILLTLLVRGVLHPLTRKSQGSMAKMQKLQPKINELQKKYGDDRQKLGQEQMKLFKKYGVSPLSGCLPMLLQLPIFISLFGALRAAIELRQAGFLWIGDLSQPDTIFQLPFSLPLLSSVFGDPIQINVLPWLMAGAMFMNQKLMTPPSSGSQADTQRQVMKFMPLFLILILYQMPSGLTLYITTSTTVGMIEHWLIRRRLADADLKPVDQEDRSSKRGKKSGKKQGKKGWFGRLMDAVEEQQKQSKQIKNNKKDKKE